MKPTAGDVWVSRPLTNVSLATIQAESNFIATRVFPVIGVPNQTGLIWRINANDFLRNEVKYRAPGTESAGGGFGLDQVEFRCLIKALHKDIDDPTRANADSVLALDATATRWLTNQMLLDMEIEWASKFFTTGVWGTDTTVAKDWGDDTSIPLTDIDDAKQAMLMATGFEPNTLVLGYPAFVQARRNADIRKHYRYTTADMIDTSMLASYFGVEKVLVSRAIKATNKEGATPVNAFIAGSGALLTYVDSNPSLMTPTAGVTFAWTGLSGAFTGYRVKRFRMEPIESDRIEVESARDMVALTPGVGTFLSGLVP